MLGLKVKVCGVLVLLIFFPASIFPQVGAYWAEDALILNPSGLELDDATSWAWGDLSNDGEIDIVVRKNGFEIESRLELWYGTGGDAPPYWLLDEDFFENLAEPDINGGVALADLDGDGRLNPITVARTDSGLQFLYWFKNASQDWSPDDTYFENIYTGRSYEINLDPAFSDLDSDGDLDMVLLTQNDGFSGVRFFENIGDKNMPQWHEDNRKTKGINPFPWGFGVIYSVALMDINFDSFADLIISADFEFSPFLHYHLAEQDSNGFYWRAYDAGIPIDFPDRGTRKLLAVDLNDDGLAELAQLELEGSGRLFMLSDSTENNFDLDYFRLGPIRFWQNASVIPVNLDEDQQTELLAIGRFYNQGIWDLYHAYEIDNLWGRRLWRNTHWFPIEPELSRGYKALFVPDLNRNGRIEFIHSLPAIAPMQAFEPVSDSIWPLRSDLLEGILNDDSQHFYSPSFCDLDGDSDQDVLVTARSTAGADSGTNKLRFFQNSLVDSMIEWIEKPDWLLGLGESSPHLYQFADLDRDDDNDLVFATSEGDLTYYENHGSRTSPEWKLGNEIFENVTVPSISAFYFCDLNNDDHADLTITDLAGRTYLYLNQKVVSVAAGDKIVPVSFHLFPNYPNPFNPRTTIPYELSEAGEVNLTLFNVRGQQVKTLYEGFQAAGTYRVKLESTGLASGVYLYELKFGNFVERRKLLLLK